ncbi:hypothetical protein lptwr_00782 [Legionella pneumophila]|uniref:Uncharacterized protein n=1 Tax=Legionella pneumophila TaxID=446 RepID=A0A378K2K3_LEGPN|nr:Uncharacterised protein [Legionella pneumophila]CZJ28798.1 Uncharacterised protein [Legionella pneumophila]CZJ48988.1 Uncharacterised protein [Legionella pneumophila]CZJ59731.1 Uncharacterised protein [Legionella pneumophila]STX78927.1 Uncharacterised protein [Legionella pneumophila]
MHCKINIDWFSEYKNKLALNDFNISYQADIPVVNKPGK